MEEKGYGVVKEIMYVCKNCKETNAPDYQVGNFCEFCIEGERH
jgi:hypothetical protein